MLVNKEKMMKQRRLHIQAQVKKAKPRLCADNASWIIAVGILFMGVIICALATLLTG
jgi:hypothetical protein